MAKEITKRSEQQWKFSDLDNNFDRLSYLTGQWVAGTHTAFEQVYHEGILWNCVAASTTDEPSETSADWVPMTKNGGIGGALMSSPTADTDIGTAYNNLDQFDVTNGFLNGCTFAPAGLFTFTFRGTWRVNLFFTFEHNSLNSGRTFSVRLRNITAPTNVGSVQFSIGRNSESTNVPLSFQAGITDANLGDQYRFQIGNAPTTITNVVFNTMRLDLEQVHALTANPA